MSSGPLKKDTKYPSGSGKKDKKKDTKCPWNYFRQINSVGENKIKEEKERRTLVAETKTENVGYSSGHKCNLSK